MPMSLLKCIEILISLIVEFSCNFLYVNLPRGLVCGGLQEKQRWSPKEATMVEYVKTCFEKSHAEVPSVWKFKMDIDHLCCVSQILCATQKETGNSQVVIFCPLLFFSSFPFSYMVLLLKSPPPQNKRNKAVCLVLG